MFNKRNRPLFGLFIWLLASLPMISVWGADGGWPMLAHDPGRSGATPTEIRPPFERKWYRLFPDEGLMSGIQVVTDVSHDANRAGPFKLYIGTLAGVLRAIDAETGMDVWTFKTGGAILHSCAVDADKVYFGCADGKVYAVETSTGQKAWTVQTGAAVWNSPALYEGLVLIGRRDGSLYAIESQSGSVKWRAETGGPLLCSPAVDAKRGSVYIGSEDMRVYALNARTGGLLWRSAKLPGVSLRGYHPVIAPDGSVMIAVAPAMSLDTFNPVLLDMVKEIFGDFASWRHTKEVNNRLREENFKLLEKAGTYEAQLNYLRKRLTDQPAYQTFFVLDPATGAQKFVTPIVYAESMNGPGAPALVTPEGKVIVKYQALLRSRYEHYSPFLNVGYLDTTTGHITPIMDQSRTYGWHDSLLLVHDEQCQLSLAGRVLINAHQDNVNAMDLDTLKGYPEPFCHNIHEPQPGEAMGIWALQLRRQSLPPGKEWLARGTAVYGGGSVLDTPVTIAGDSFYYVPTHEINAGAAVIAYKMQSDGTAGKRSEPPKTTVSPEEWSKIQQLPWDWDTLEMARLNHVLTSLPGKLQGTRLSPATNAVGASLAPIADAHLDEFIWETPVFGPGAASESEPDRPEESSAQIKRLQAELARVVGELISNQWQPLVFPAGKHPEEAYRFFNEPTETLFTIALAYPHLDGLMQQAVKEYVDAMFAAGGPLDGATGRRVYPADHGAVRSAYDLPPEHLLKIADNFTRSDIARVYPLWLWAHVTGDWGHITNRWQDLRRLVDQPPNKIDEDCGNGHVAGLIAYCRVAKKLDDAQALVQGVVAARTAMRQRLAYEFALPRGGLITRVPVGRSIFGRWEFLTPEVGRLLATYAKWTHRQLMDVYVDYHRPTWWLSWNVETMMRNECPFSFPTVAHQVFAARALILNESPDKLASFIDLPWCKADEYYIQKIAHSLNAARQIWPSKTQRPPARK